MATADAAGGEPGAVLTVLRSLLDLVLPATCAGCGAAETSWCPDCATTLRGPARRAAPDPGPADLPPTWAVAGYAGAVRAAVVAHKEHGVLALTRPLGAALALAVRAAAVRSGAVPDGRPLALVPAPSRAAAVRERGRDPTLRLAEAAAAVLRGDGRPVVVAPVLRMRRSARDQAGLGRGARAANLAGAVRVARGSRARLRDHAVLLVDDVVTTGATLAECATVLRDDGSLVAAAAVVAATARDQPWGRSALSPRSDRG
ncbi:MAG: ComF family protein [Sporichthyaceae bacterium]